MDPTALIGGLVVTIIGGIIVVFVQKWLESREKQRKKDALAPAEFAPPELPTPEVLNNLPQPGEFIGRDREKALVREALASRSYLVCIDGIGGIGKTALALEVANRCLRASKGEIPADGIPTFDAFVWTTAKDRELALSDILDTIARTLDYPYIAQLPPEEKPSEAAKLLRAQRCLLIVDNFETITDDAVRDFLLNLPDPSKALITSREQKLRQARAISLRAMEQGEALALIRSEGRRLGLPAVENAEEKVLLRLYQATGGAPLAIKWAVGQMKQRGQSLDMVLDYLYEARGDVFENIFARSWGFLSENARCVLMVMPIFATSASKPALEAASDVHKWDLDEALGQLVEMWLMEASEELGEAKRRYSVHPLTRAFARRRLSKDPEFEENAYAQLSRYFLREFGEYGGHRNWLGYRGYDQMQSDLSNILAVKEWHRRHNNRQGLIQFGELLTRFLYVRGYWAERIKLGREVVDAARYLGDDRTQAIFLLEDVGWTLTRMGNIEGEKYLRKALHTFDEIGDIFYRVRARSHLTGHLMSQGLDQLDEASRLCKECLGLSINIGEEVDRMRMIAATEINLRKIENLRENPMKAREHCIRALALYENIGDKIKIAGAKVFMGDIERNVHNYERARKSYMEVLDQPEAKGRPELIADAKVGLAKILEIEGKLVRALELAAEARVIYQSYGRVNALSRTQAFIERLERAMA